MRYRNGMRYVRTLKRVNEKKPPKRGLRFRNATVGGFMMAASVAGGQ
jgi:hypothetical protein